MLLVGGCDCTKFVDGVLRQTETVRAMIGSDVPIHGVLCSVGADWPLVGGSFNVNGAASSGGERRSPSLSPARLSGLQPRRSRARRERRQWSRRTRGPARHPGSCAPPCLQPDWVEDEAGDDDGGNARCDRHYVCEGGFVERPLLDGLYPLLQGLGCAEKADLLLEHRQRWLVMNGLIRLPVEGQGPLELALLHRHHLTVQPTK